MMLLYAALALVTGVLDICHGAELRLPPLSSSRSTMMQKYLPLAQKAMEYINASSDPFHAVQTSVDSLRAAGFEPWNSNDNASASSSAPPALQAGGKYYFTKNKSTLVAFAVGKHYKPGNGLKIIAGHTDSPNLRVKTRSQRGSPSSTVGGCLQIGVECYGGGLWHVSARLSFYFKLFFEHLWHNSHFHSVSRPGLIETWGCRDASLYDHHLIATAAAARLSNAWSRLIEPCCVFPILPFICKPPRNEKHSITIKRIIYHRFWPWK